MEFVNYSSFEAVTFDALDKEEQEHHVVVIQGTYDISADSALSLAAEQMPPLATDQFVGAINQSSLRRESDFAPYKPNCDVILDATAYAPGGKPATAFHVSIRITKPSSLHRISPKSGESAAAANHTGRVVLEKTLLVSGPHHWVPGILGGWTLTRPRPIKSLPLRYEYSFGGMVTVYDAASERERTVCCAANPVGVGYWPDSAYKEAARRKKIPAPQVFTSRDFTFGKEHAPQGFGPICRSWQPRLKLAGSYDEGWQKGRWPNLPEDFDDGFWNCAHPDLVIPFLEGDEEVQLKNLTPNGDLRFRLPSQEPVVCVRYGSGEIDEVKAELDTLFIEPDKGKVSLVWRTRMPTDREVRVLELRVIAPAERNEDAAQ